ncbi:unnamed protein product [Owenia fusiformis]|uniref:Uncharacterized protein n=1 Tax=Owenia fusiformis TaxID=6347 RepID=A0A8S4PR09_OWEFU|nr:unnamed protein product [Owenia fusiformis]
MADITNINDQVPGWFKELRVGNKSILFKIDLSPIPFPMEIPAPTVASPSSSSDISPDIGDHSKQSNPVKEVNVPQPGMELLPTRVRHAQDLVWLLKSLPDIANID